MKERFPGEEEIARRVLAWWRQMDSIYSGLLDMFCEGEKVPEEWKQQYRLARSQWKRWTMIEEQARTAFGPTAEWKER